MVRWGFLCCRWGSRGNTFGPPARLDVRPAYGRAVAIPYLNIYFAIVCNCMFVVPS